MHFIHYYITSHLKQLPSPPQHSDLCLEHGCEPCSANGGPTGPKGVFQCQWGSYSTNRGLPVPTGVPQCQWEPHTIQSQPHRDQSTLGDGVQSILP